MPPLVRPSDSASTGKRACGYIRLSTRQQQEKGHSKESQIREVRAYCERQGYRLVRLIIDVGGKRRNMSRDKLGIIMDLAERGAMDVVVVRWRDRFGAGDDVSAVERFLRKMGVRLEAVSTGPQSNTAVTRAMNKVMDVFMDLDMDMRVEKTTEGRYESARKGNWVTAPIFGWKWDYTGYPEKPRTMVVDEEAAAKVRAAYEAAVAGKTVRDIAVAMGCQSHATAINRLHKTAYKGVAVWGGVEVPLPPIVDAGLWERAQHAILARNNAEKGRRGAAPSRTGPPGDESPGPNESPSVL